MKILPIIFSKLAVVVFFCSTVFSQVQSIPQNNDQGNNIRLVNPLYDSKITNLQTSNSPLANVLFFDIYILHTNDPDSGPFEYAAGQYYLEFNPDAINGGTLEYTKVPNSSDFANPDAVPINPSVVGNQLRLERNPELQPGTGPIISTIFPGTKVVRMKLRSNGNPIDVDELNLRWRDSTDGDPYTQTFAFIDGVRTNITSGGTYTVDSTNDPLPVELLNFSASISENNALLNWTTAAETNNQGFEIERSSAYNQWIRIGFVDGNGTTSSQNNYFFKDKSLSSGSYKYRLKQIDYNGSFEYFNLQGEISIGKPDEFDLSQNYPNPFNPETKIDFRLPEDGSISLNVYDMKGSLVSRLIEGNIVSGYHSVEFNSAELSSGIYYYKIEFNGSNRTFGKVMKMVVLK